MATSGLVGKMSDIITCEICLESFHDKEPWVLACLHVIGEQHIQSLLNTAAARNPNYDNTLVCPTSKVGIEIPLGQAASLPLFLHSQKIEEILKECSDVCKIDIHLAEGKSYCFTYTHGMCEKYHHTGDNCIEVTGAQMKNLTCCCQHDTHMEYLCEHYDHGIGDLPL